MLHTIAVLIAVTLPTPVYYGRQRLEQSPTWNKDPVRVARFVTIDHMTHRAQMTATEQGRKTYADYLAERRSNRMPIVGQIQQSTSVNYSFTRAIVDPVPYTPRFPSLR